MYLAELPKALVRQWLCVLVGLVLTSALAVSVMQTVPVQYTTSAYLLLLPPSSTVPDGGNPFLVLGGLEPAVDVTAQALTSPQGAALLEDEGATGVFTVEPDVQSSGPMLLVTVEDVTAAGALKTLGLVVEAVPATLQDVQRSVKVPEDSLIRSTLISRDVVASPSRRPQLRAVLAAVAVGLAVTSLVAGRIDNLRTRRREEARARMAGRPHGIAAVARGAEM